MRSQDLFKILKNNGWILKSIVGSHHNFIHPVKSGKVTGHIFVKI
ncbi:MAG: type II toxin-antitoxin system HicA family toxin [Fusobacteriaceae bacterium]